MAPLFSRKDRADFRQEKLFRNANQVDKIENIKGIKNYHDAPYAIKELTG